MAWARIDDNFFNHPKVYKAGKDAVLFHIAALCHSNAFLTEGFIEDAIVDLIGKQAFQRHPVDLANKLVEVELWERVKGGYYIHDFLKYNHTKAEIEEANAKRRVNGVQGGRPAKPRQNLDDNQTITELGSAINRPVHTTQNLDKTYKPIPSHPIPILKDKESTAEAFSGKNADIYASFEAIAPVDERLRPALDSAVNIYSSGWVRDAIAEGVSHNAHTFGYVNKVLESWKKNGRNGSGRKPAKQAATIDDFRKLYDDQKASEG